MKLRTTIFLILIFAAATFGQAQSDRNKAIELYQQEDYRGAVPILQSIVQEDKTDWNTWLYLGMSLAKTDKGEESYEAFRQGAAFYPKKQYLNEEVFKITAKPRPNYTDLARSNRVSGIVALAVEFRADGKIGTIIPLKPLPSGLTKNAVEAAKKVKFKPMLKEGKPITIVRILEYSFQIY